MHTVVFELQAVNGVQYQFSLKFSIAYGRRSGLLIQGNKHFRVGAKNEGQSGMLVNLGPSEFGTRSIGEFGTK